MPRLATSMDRESELEEPGPGSFAWRQCPIFVSSTFRDMHAERDCLRDLVFPAIDERLRQRRRYLVPIDLRWGVDTVGHDDKEALVLQVCFQEIRRAHRLMLVLLGDRYGWVPPLQRVRAAIEELAAPIRDVTDKSVTELEIEYGAFAGVREGRALFLFRELDVAGMDDAARRIHDDRSDGRADAWSRLQRLKAEIRGRFADRTLEYSARWDPAARRVVLAPEWASTVTEALWNTLERDGSSPASSAAVRWEASARTSLLDEIAVRLEGIVHPEAQTPDSDPSSDPGRVVHRGVHDALLRFARGDGDGAAWALCLVGESGSGKSVVFARIVSELGAFTGRGAVLAHFAGAGPRSTNPYDVLRRWCAELCQMSGEPAPDYDAVVDLGALRAELHTLLAEVSARGPVVLCVDGLDQLDGSPEARNVAWLPDGLPPGVRLLAAAAPCEAEQILSARPGVCRVELPALGESGARAIVRARCRNHHKQPNERVVAAVAERAMLRDRDGYGTALWVSLAVERLFLLDLDDFAAIEAMRVTGDDEKIVEYQLELVRNLPSDVDHLHDVVFSRARRVGGDWVAAALDAIAVSRFGLREPELRKLAGISAPEHDLGFSAARRVLHGFLGRRADLDTWDLLHGAARRHLLGRLDAARVAELHARIADQFETLPPNDALRGEIMHHRVRAGDERRAAEYFGGALEVPEREAAIRCVVAELLIDADESRPAGLAERLLAVPLPVGVHLRIARRLLFDVAAGLVGRASVALRERLMAGCVEALERAVRDPELSQAAAAECRHDLLEAWRRCAALLREQQRFDAARAASLRALHLAHELTSADPNRIEWIHDVALCCLDLGDALRDQGELVPARDAYVRALDVCDDVVRRAPDDERLQLSRVGVAQRAADLLRLLGQHGVARSAYSEAREVLEALLRLAPSWSEARRALASTHEKLGALEHESGALTAALAQLDLARAELESLAVDEPRNRELRHDLARVRGRIADIHAARRQADEAVCAYRDVERTLSDLCAADPRNVGYRRDLEICKQRLRALGALDSD